MNKRCGTGRLERDPELRQAGETQVVKVTVAVNRRFKVENQPDADFIPIEIWGKRAEFAISNLWIVRLRLIWQTEWVFLR